MQTITISITIPDGATVAVDQGVTPPTASSVRSTEEIERYFRDYLSENGRKLYQAAARVERHNNGGGYTLSDLAANLNIDYASAQSFHRTSGRSARKWHDDTATEAPIVLKDLVYGWVKEENGMRTSYQLPPGVADVIEHL